jgi:hypothetical protein
MRAEAGAAAIGPAGDLAAGRKDPHRRGSGYAAVICSRAP